MKKSTASLSFETSTVMAPEITMYGVRSYVVIWHTRVPVKQFKIFNNSLLVSEHEAIAEAMDEIISLRRQDDEQPTNKAS